MRQRELRERKGLLEVEARTPLQEPVEVHIGSAEQLWAVS